jgi:hypothetical protein
MRFEAISFGSICIDGTTYGYDLVIAGWHTQPRLLLSDMKGIGPIGRMTWRFLVRTVSPGALLYGTPFDEQHTSERGSERADL